MEIRSMSTVIEEAKAIVSLYRACPELLTVRICQALIDAERALEFYADIGNYLVTAADTKLERPIDERTGEYVEVVVGDRGAKAREALANLRREI